MGVNVSVRLGSQGQGMLGSGSGLGSGLGQPGLVLGSGLGSGLGSRSGSGLGSGSYGVVIPSPILHCFVTFLV